MDNETDNEMSDEGRRAEALARGFVNGVADIIESGPDYDEGPIPRWDDLPLIYRGAVVNLLNDPAIMVTDLLRVAKDSGL